MPINKEAYLRYKIIDACLTNKQHKYPSMEDLIAVCEQKLGKSFSVSTLQKDIKAMKEDEVLGFLAPIKFSKSNNGYYYSEKEYSIRNIPLNENDIEALLSAADLLSTFNGNRVSAEFGNAIDKILTSCKEVYDQSVDKRTIVQTDKMPTQRGWNFFDFFFNAAKQNIPTNFVHYNYQKRTFNSIILHPYLLKEFQNRWYIIGYSENHKEVRTFGLDRIMEPYLIDEKFYLTPDFDAEKHFKNTYGVYPLTQKIEKVIFDTSTILSDYLIAQPIHESQKIEHFYPYGRLKLSLTLIPSQELINFFRMNKNEIFIHEPQWVKQEVEK